MDILIKPTFFIAIYHLLENKQLKKHYKLNNGLTQTEIIKFLGYQKYVNTYIIRLLSYFIKTKILYQISFNNMRPIRYIINWKKLEDLFESSPFFIASLNYWWGGFGNVPLPSELRKLKKLSKTNNNESN